MSGIASGITKVFSAVGQTAAKVSQAVMGVGASTFTAGAATGAKSLAAGGLSGFARSAGRSTLGNMVSGAIRQAGIGAVIGAGVGAVTGQGAMKGALYGGLGGAVTGAATGAFQPTGVGPPGAGGSGMTPNSYAPTGLDPSGSVMPAVAPASQAPLIQPSASTVTTGGGGLGSKLGKFLFSEAGGQMIAGLGGGLLQGMAKRDELKAAEKLADADRRFILERDQRVQDSYNVDPSVLAGNRSKRYRFDPDLGEVVAV